MIRLYFDTCILNDFFALIQYEYGEGMRAKDVKAPLSRWTPEYIALYYLLNLVVRPTSFDGFYSAKKSVKTTLSHY